MKHNHWQYGVVIAVVLGIFIGFINYTRGALPKQAPQTQTNVHAVKNYKKVTTSETIPALDQKASCGCCAERKARIQKMIQQARERRLAKQAAVSTIPN